MLDAFQVFTKGGLILFHWQLADDALKSSPVEALVKTCLLEERAGRREFVHTSGTSAHTLKWTFHNELGLVFSRRCTSASSASRTSRICWRAPSRRSRPDSIATRRPTPRSRRSSRG